MTTTIFTADATLDSFGDATLDGYEQLVLKAREYGLDSEAVTAFEPFVSTERGMEYRAYAHLGLNKAVVAKVYVK